MTIKNEQLILDIDSDCQKFIVEESVIYETILEVIKHQKLSSASVSLFITNSDNIKSINFKYRNKNIPTNVLSFVFDIPPELPLDALEENFLGDIIICPEVLENEAMIQNKKLEDHWRHILIHGVLHLLGYDHTISSEAEIMESIEIDILSILGIANPYNERE